jgi:hypothetical protein
MRFNTIMLHVPSGFLLAVYCFCKLVILIVFNKKKYRMLVEDKYSSNNKIFSFDPYIDMKINPHNLTPIR